MARTWLNIYILIFVTKIMNLYFEFFSSSSLWRKRIWYNYMYYNWEYKPLVSVSSSLIDMTLGTLPQVSHLAQWRTPFKYLLAHNAGCTSWCFNINIFYIFLIVSCTVMLISRLCMIFLSDVLIFNRINVGHLVN